MKKKLIIIIFFGIAISILIYNITLNNKLRLMALGDGLAMGMTAYNVKGYSYNDYIKDEFKKNNNIHSYNDVFCETGLTTAGLINKINSNEKVIINDKEVTIKQAIASANIITLGIGMDEITNISLNKKLDNDAIDDYLNNIDKILSLIKKYNHEKVIVISLYDAYNIKNISKINYELKNIVESYNYEFVDISKVINIQDYKFNETSYYINYKGHKKIKDEIMKVL